MENVDFGKVRQIAMGDVLSHYGIETRRQGDFLVAKRCPLPTHGNAADTGTFKANVPANWWTCFSDSCKKGLGKRGGDVIDFVCIMESVKPLPAAMKLMELFRGVPVNNAISRGEERNKPLAWALQGVSAEHPMIQSRGISKETAEAWGAGYYRSKQETASMDGRIVFPLYEDGHLVGYAGRTISAETSENPKWKLGKGLKKSFLYGLERCVVEKPVILVESPWAVLWFFERGQQAAAIIGTQLTEEQERRLDPFPNIVVAMDNDDKGREAAEKIAGRLREKHRVTKSFLKE